MPVIVAADLFCGAGGTSTGLALACQELDFDLDLVAINHWDVAIQTHSTNHPDAKHLCTNLDNVDPRKVVPGGRLGLLVASPECTHHSNARGGKPMLDQSRASGWHVLRWAEALYIENIIIENVREFMNWGPLGANGRPLESKKGQTFQAFLNGLKSLGYNVEYRLLNAADFGDPTTRIRLFIIARRGNKKIVWPKPTHSKTGKIEFFGKTEDIPKWRAAREIIDWSIPGESILKRKKPLAASTMNRIFAGLEKFGGKEAEPFLIVFRNHQAAQSLDEPLPALTTSGANFALVDPQPFLISQFGERKVHLVDKPLQTITTTSRGIGLVQPYLVRYNGGNNPREQGRVHSVDQPMPTIASGGIQYGLVEPMVIAIDHTGGNGHQVRSVDDPLSTISTKERHALVEPIIVPLNHGKDDKRSHSVDAPMPSLTTVDAWGLAQPYLVKFYGNGENVASVDEPLDTVTSRDTFGLVEPDKYTVDIRFRMLQPHELARAMSFGDDYVFSGTREAKVKQIGNAVPVNLAKELCKAVLGDAARKKAQVQAA